MEVKKFADSSFFVHTRWPDYLFKPPTIVCFGISGYFSLTIKVNFTLGINHYYCYYLPHVPSFTIIIIWLSRSLKLNWGRTVTHRLLLLFFLSVDGSSIFKFLYQKMNYRSFENVIKISINFHVDFKNWGKVPLVNFNVH